MHQQVATPVDGSGEVRSMCVTGLESGGRRIDSVIDFQFHNNAPSNKICWPPTVRGNICFTQR